MPTKSTVENKTISGKFSEQDLMDVCCGLSILADHLEAEAKKLDEKFGSYHEAHSLRERSKHIVLKLRQKFGAKDRNKRVAKMQKAKTVKGQKTIDDEIKARAREGAAGKDPKRLTKEELEKRLQAAKSKKTKKPAEGKKTAKKKVMRKATKRSTKGAPKRGMIKT